MSWDAAHRRPDSAVLEALRGGRPGALPAEEARRTLSIDVPGDRDDRGIRADGGDGGRHDSGYEAAESRLAAEGAALDDRERRVLWLRFEEGLTQHEIGSLLGVSQMQVSRIMRAALRKLLAAVQGQAPEPAS